MAQDQDLLGQGRWCTVVQLLSCTVVHFLVQRFSFFIYGGSTSFLYTGSAFISYFFFNGSVCFYFCAVDQHFLFFFAVVVFNTVVQRNGMTIYNVCVG